MKRFISNYTILASGEELINHITTVGDDGTLISIHPFDREMANTCYVPAPLCVAAPDQKERIEEIFSTSPSREQFEQRLAELKELRPQFGDAAVVLRLDFAQNRITTINYYGTD